MKNKSKFTYPKCPYCKSEYTEKLGSMKYGLMKLATEGWCENITATVSYTHLTLPTIRLV